MSFLLEPIFSALCVKGWTEYKNRVSEKDIIIGYYTGCFIWKNVKMEGCSLEMIHFWILAYLRFVYILIQIPGMSGYSIDVEALRTAQQQQNSSVTSNDSSQNQKSDATSSPSTESSPRYEPIQ